MEIDLNITSIEVSKDTYDFLLLAYDDKEVVVEKSITMVFKKFHDTIIGESRIMLMKKSFPWDVCNGVVLLSNSFLKHSEEGCEHTSDILHGRYYDKVNSYDVYKREVVGTVRYWFSRRICESNELCSESSGDGFVKKMFEYFLSDDKAGAIISIKKLMDYINSGSNSCKISIFFGGILVERSMSDMNARFAKDVDLVLEKNEESLPKLFEPFYIESANNSSDNCGNACRRSVLFKIRLDGDGEDEPMRMSRILSSNGYTICDMAILRGMKRLLYFTVCSYAISWPGMFLKPQAQVDKSIQGDRRAVLRILAIEDSDLLKVCLDASEVVQHVVFYDREHRRMVVSFKGTTNSEDAIEDINCEYTRFSDGFAHNGFLRLSMLFINNHIDAIRQMLEAMSCSRLLLSGHSLGGAISVMTKIIVEEKKLLPGVNVEAIGFSAPPVVSEEIASRYTDGIAVINYGNDIIPRMSFGSILDLKFLCCSIGKRYGPFDFGKSIEKDIDVVVEHLGTTKMHPKLYFAGEIVHLKRIRCSLDGNESPIVVFRMVDMSFFESIVLIKHAPKHHMMSHIESVIDEGIEILERKHGDTHG
ncbi:lipase [Ordospora pajunii]|uniref:lipase n=1 Tax=Ordospora pajunii TaxID=3039483 RepID=UPI002952849F|nr:lipase [Ordospora pajunii]KAH9411665.1 lipase [Ordospora pajunii]